MDTTQQQRIDILNIWHTSKGACYGKSRHNRLLYTLEHFMNTHPDANKSFCYKYLTGEV